MEMLDAFSAPLAQKSLERCSEINDVLHRKILDLSGERPSDDKGRAHIGVWYSRGGFFQQPEPEIIELKKFLLTSLREYIGQIVSPSFGDQAKIQLKSWVALTQPKQYQVPHIHAGTHVSGVYYVRVPDRPSPEGDIVFLTPVGEQELSFFREISATSVTVKPRPGLLVIFPSYLRHFTHPFFEGEDRSCVVFTAKVSN